jgi:hypothetical protein
MHVFMAYLLGMPRFGYYHLIPLTCFPIIAFSSVQMLLENMKRDILRDGMEWLDWDVGKQSSLCVLFLVALKCD